SIFCQVASCPRGSRPACCLNSRRRLGRDSLLVSVCIGGSARLPHTPLAPRHSAAQFADVVSLNLWRQKPCVLSPSDPWPSRRRFLHSPVPHRPPMLPSANW